MFPGNLVVIGGECAEGRSGVGTDRQFPGDQHLRLPDLRDQLLQTYDPVGAVWTVGTGSGGVGPVTGAANAPASAVMP